MSLDMGKYDLKPRLKIYENIEQDEREVAIMTRTLK